MTSLTMAILVGPQLRIRAIYTMWAHYNLVFRPNLPKFGLLFETARRTTESIITNLIKSIL